ncbi:MAG: rod shape-determining protein MreC [Proteobacteria bacterium]|nr:rod shape-determining protein MreC [Pseudomonadota bacterium]MBU0966017.1 rod shape-determining protein MreC [Pseudomonadota bacterium]
MRKKNKKSKQIQLFFLFGSILTFILILIASTVGRQELNGPQRLALDLIGKGQYVFTRLTTGVANVWADYIALVHIRDENKRLSEELDKFKETNIKYREAVATNVRLSKLLQVKDSLPPPTLTAQIVGRDPSLWFRTIIIDRGSSEGVEKGMPVVTVEGVVGQILDTSPNYSKVLLANDPNSAIDVLVQKNRVQGIVKGNGSNGFNLLYVLKNADVEKGDAIVTSGLGDIFPKGLPVGTVSEVTKSKRGMFQQIDVEPSVDFSQLEYLIIIMHENSLADQDFGKQYH